MLSRIRAPRPENVHSGLGIGIEALLLGSFLLALGFLLIAAHTLNVVPIVGMVGLVMGDVERHFSKALSDGQRWTQLSEDPYPSERSHCLAVCCQE